MTENQKKMAELLGLTEENFEKMKKLSTEERFEIIEGAVIEIAAKVFGGADND